MARFTCGFEGCKNAVREQGLRCHLHVGKYENAGAIRGFSFTHEDYVSRARLHRAVTKNPLFVHKLINPPAQLGQEGIVAERHALYGEHLGVPPEVVDAVYDISSDMGIGHTRQSQAEAIRNGGLDEFKSRLISRIGAERVSVLEVSDLSFTDPKAPATQHVSYRALVVDFDGEGECVVDPFAKVLVGTKANGEHYVSECSPILDEVCMSTINEYVDGEMKWKNVRVVLPNGQSVTIPEIPTDEGDN